MCLYETQILNRKYLPNKKNGGIVPPLPLLYDPIENRIKTDWRVKYVPSQCGKCMECMKKRARDWQIRLQEEIKDEKNGIFVTLTFNTQTLRKLQIKHPNKQGYDLDNAIATTAVRLFTERWRKHNKKPPRHWLVTELGHSGTEHVHLHGIIFTNKGGAEIEKRWNWTDQETKIQYGGWVWDSDRKKGYVNECTVNYITKYVYKVDQDHKYYKPIVLSSKGMGKGYLKRINARLNIYKGAMTDETWKSRQNIKMSLPQYYRKKLYNDEQREELWRDKMDAGKAYIDKLEIDISKNDLQYYLVLEEARRKNIRLGYGTNEIDYEKRQEERNKRNEIHIQRLMEKEYENAPF